MVVVLFVKRYFAPRRLLNYFRQSCGAYSRAAFIRVAALNRSYTVLILTFFSCFSRIRAGACVWVLLQYCMTCVHEPTQHSDWPLLTSVIDRQQIFVFLKICINRNCSSVECLSYVPLHRFSMNSNSRGRQKSYISNIVPVRLSERVWCTKIFSLLLKSYFHLSGFQYSFILIYFRDGPKKAKGVHIARLTQNLSGM